MVKILRLKTDAHNFAMFHYVLRHVGIAGLDKLLCDDSFALLHQPAGYVAGHVGLAGIGVDA